MKKTSLQFKWIGGLLMLTPLLSLGQINQLNKIESAGVIPLERASNSIAHNDKLYFTGITPAGDKELIEMYKNNNGTYTTTIFDVTPGFDLNRVEHSGDPHEYISGRTGLYFVASDENKVEGLYCLDNTGQVKKIVPTNDAIEFPSGLVVFEGKIYFAAKKKGEAEKILRYYDPTTNELWSIINSNSREIEFIYNPQKIAVINESTLHYTKTIGSNIVFYDLKRETLSSSSSASRTAIIDFNSSRSNRERGTFTVNPTDVVSEPVVGLDNYFLAVGNKVYSMNDDTLGVLISTTSSAGDLYYNEGNLYFSYLNRGLTIGRYNLNKNEFKMPYFSIPSINKVGDLNYTSIPSAITFTPTDLGSKPANIVSSNIDFGSNPSPVIIFDGETSEKLNLGNDPWNQKSNKTMVDGKLLVFGKRKGASSSEVAEWKTVGPVGVLESELNTISLSPNPATNFLHVVVNNQMNYEILSLTGVTIKKGELYNSVIEISELAKGPYILKLEDGSNQTFIKE